MLSNSNTEHLKTYNANKIALDLYQEIDLNQKIYFDGLNWKKIHMDISNEDLRFMLHKAKYPQRFTLNYSSSAVKEQIFNKSVILKFKDKNLEINAVQLSKMVFIEDSNLYINPLIFLNYLEENQISFQPSKLDFNDYENFVPSAVPDFKKAITQINKLLNQSDSIEYSFEYILPIPSLLNADGLKVQKKVFTSFYGSNYERNFNVNHAIKKLNLIKLSKGQEFSFLDSIGDISKATGYLDSLVITQGGFVSQAGGGVCQVSSTLYYAALNAGFDITERYNHSKAISYYAQVFDYGLDATIYPGQKDLKFVNPYDFDVYLFSYYYDYQMHTLILANQALPEVELILLEKNVEHPNQTILELNKDQNTNSKEPEIIQNYIPQIQTTWQRKYLDKTENINSFYKSQVKVVDYSKS